MEYEIEYERQNAISAFHNVFKIRIRDGDKDTFHKKTNYTSAKELAKWCSENFKNNYIMKCTMSELISGGCTDNKKYWWRPHKELISYDYTLSCDDEDATLFKLTWM